MERRKSDNRLPAVVIRHINCFLEGTGIPVERFTRVHILPQLINAGELTKPKKDVEKWEKSQARRLVRYIDGENQLNSNWIHPFVSSLPAEQRQMLVVEMCGMLGSFFVPLTAMGPQTQSVSTRSHLPQMAKEWGDILIGSNPAIDGEFTSGDDPIEVMNYANEVAECIGILMAELGAIYRGTGIEPAAVRAFRHSSLFQ